MTTEQMDWVDDETAGRHRPPLAGPNSGAILQQERELLDRGRRLTGWAAAAALHARVDRSTQVHNLPICRSCTDLAQLAAGRDADDWPTVVTWPCDTATALGLDR